MPIPVWSIHMVVMRKRVCDEVMLAPRCTGSGKLHLKFRQVWQSPPSVWTYTSNHVKVELSFLPSSSFSPLSFPLHLIHVLTFSLSSLSPSLSVYVISPHHPFLHLCPCFILFFTPNPPLHTHTPSLSCLFPLRFWIWPGWTDGDVITFLMEQESGRSCHLHLHVSDRGAVGLDGGGRAWCDWWPGFWSG